MKTEIREKIESCKLLWEVTKITKWPNTDYDAIKHFLRGNINEKQAKQLREEEKIIENILYKDISRHEAAEMGAILGNDSGEDLIAHIVGKGKNFVIDFLNRKNEVISDIKQNGFVENFSYCLPYEDDYADVLDIDNESKKIQEKIKKNINIIEENNELSKEYKDSFKMEMRRFNDIFTHIKNGCLDNIDYKKVSKRVNEVNNKFILAGIVLKNKTGDVDIIDYSLSNLVRNANAINKAIKMLETENYDFSKFDQNYIKNFKKINNKKNKLVN